MNILILNWMDVRNPQMGGAEIILFEIAKRLVCEGHQITWFSRQYRNCLKEEKINGLEIKRQGNKFTVYLEAYKYYRSLKFKPDLVIDSVNTLCWQTPLYVPKNQRIAYVNQLAKEVFFYESPALVSHLSYFLERLEFITYRSTKFLCYSKSTRKDLVGFGIPEKKISLFSIGLDHARYFDNGLKEKNPLFICVNRLVKMKRTDLVIKAMVEVSQKYPLAKLGIVGYGYQRKELGLLRDKLNLKKNVFFIDENMLFLDKNKKDKKVELMQKAWALVFPSVKEGWGMTVTESAACATPSIVSNVSGLRDSVIKNRTGIVLSKNPSTAEIALAMIKIIEDKKIRKILSTNAVKQSQLFSWEKAVADFKKAILI